MLKKMMTMKSSKNKEKDDANRDELFGEAKQDYQPPNVVTGSGSSVYTPAALTPSASARYSTAPASSATPPAYNDDAQYQQMVDGARQKAIEGKQGTQRCLSIVENTLQLGTETANKLYAQTTQLEGLNTSVSGMHTSLDESDQHIKGFTLLGKFTSRAKKVAKPKLENTPVRMNNDGTTVGAAEDTAKRAELFKSASVVVRSGSNNHCDPNAPPELNELRLVMSEQDEDLTQISGALTRMKTLAVNMGSELKHQEVLINNLDKNLDYTEARVKDTTRRVSKHL